MERKGVDTFIGNLNRKIKKFNERRKTISEELKDIRIQLLDLIYRPKEEIEKERRENAVYSLLDYLEIRKQERLGWSQGAEIKCGSKDLKQISLLVGYLQNNDIHTIREFMGFRDKKLEQWNKINSSMNGSKKRIKEIEGILSHLEIRNANREVHNNYVKIPWKGPKKLYYGMHEEELGAYNKADRFIRKWYSDGKVPVKSIQEEKRKLESEMDDLNFKKEDMKDEVSWVKQIDTILKKIRPEMYEEKKEMEAAGVKKKPDEKSNEVERKAPVTADSKQRVPGKDKPVKAEDRPSLIKKMNTMKKELDQRERAERSRGSRIIKKDRAEPSR